MCIVACKAFLWKDGAIAMAKGTKHQVVDSPVEIQQLLTIDQVAELLGVSRVTVYDMIRYEGLPILRLRKRLRVIPLSLQQWLTEREQASRKEVSHGFR